MPFISHTAAKSEKPSEAAGHVFHLKPPHPLLYFMHVKGQQRAQPPLSSSHSKFHLQISNGFTTESPKMSASTDSVIAKLKKARQGEMSEFRHQHQQKTGLQPAPCPNQ